MMVSTQQHGLLVAITMLVALLATVATCSGSGNGLDSVEDLSESSGTAPELPPTPAPPVPPLDTPEPPTPAPDNAISSASSAVSVVTTDDSAATTTTTEAPATTTTPVPTPTTPTTVPNAEDLVYTIQARLRLGGDNWVTVLQDREQVVALTMALMKDIAKILEVAYYMVRIDRLSIGSLVVDYSLANGTQYTSVDELDQVILQSTNGSSNPFSLTQKTYFNATGDNSSIALLEVGGRNAAEEEDKGSYCGSDISKGTCIGVTVGVVLLFIILIVVVIVVCVLSGGKKSDEEQQKQEEGGEKYEEAPAADASPVAIVPAGYVWDAESQLYWSDAEQYYLDTKSGEYYNPTDEQWYRCDVIDAKRKSSNGSNNTQQKQKQQSAEPIPTQQSPTPAAADVPEGYVFDAESGLYWSDEDQYYFDLESGHYYDGESGQWFNPDTEEWYAAE